MNILIIGDAVFSSCLGGKLKQSHHYNQHFILCTNQLINELEVSVNISLDAEDAILNFCIENKIDVVVLAHQQFLENGFYDKLKENSFLNRTIIVGAAKETIQQFSNSTNEQKEIVSDSKNIEQIVVLTDGANYKVLNERDEQQLKLIEQQIIKKVIEKDVNISGFLCFNVFRKDENYELASYQFVMNDDVAATIFERLETDVLSLFAAMDNGTLEDVIIEFYDKK